MKTFYIIFGQGTYRDLLLTRFVVIEAENEQDALIIATNFLGEYFSNVVTEQRADYSEVSLDYVLSLKERFYLGKV